jgi:catechol 2,3-dioxygenase-like lactoylglutathione lyase family enzyme
MSMFSEISLVTLSVEDLGAAVRFYCDSFAYTSLGAGEGSPAFLRAWQAAPGIAARYEVMGHPQATAGVLRLVEFNRAGAGTSPSGGSPPAAAYPFRSLGFSVSDCAERLRRLIANGAIAGEPPTGCVDPSGVAIELGEAAGHDANDIDCVTIEVADVERALRFYAAIGFEPGESSVRAGGRNPRSLRLFQHDRPQRAGIALTERTQSGGTDGVRARVPERGIFGLSIETASLGAAESLIRDHSLEIIAGPLVTVTPPFARVHSFTCYGPDGEMLAFFQRFA